MSRKNWEINGLSLEFDNQDADNMERYENAFDLMEKEAKQLPKDGRVSERIRAYCNVFRNLFDRIFGKGTSEKLFDGVPMSSERYEEIYTQFLEFVREQNDASHQRHAARISAYLPNRKQRRSAAKNK